MTADPTAQPGADLSKEALDELEKDLRRKVTLGTGVVTPLRIQAADTITALRAEKEAHEEAAADSRRLAREIDVAMHGEEGAAKQASLCDLVAPARELRAKIDALAAKKERKTFPILNGGGARFDYQLVADHSEQARANHYQTVDRLAARGGLSWAELHAVLHDRKFQKIDGNDAIRECRAIEARYLAALEPAERDREALVAALEWYGENARLARLIHSEGDAGRYALSHDGGERARKALATHAQTDALAAVRREARAPLIEALDAIEELNKTGADEDGHRWDHSDLIAQEIAQARQAIAAAEKEAGHEN